MEQIEMYDSGELSHLLHQIRPQDNDWVAFLLHDDMVLMLEDPRIDEGDLVE